jgi:hypothetical protein
MRHAQVATTMNVYGNSMMKSKREANSKVVQMALKPESKGRKGDGHSGQKLARLDQLPLSAPASETSDARNPMKRLVAGGGFELQSRIDSTQLVDSTLREIGKNGNNGESFVHFSYTF